MFILDDDKKCLKQKNYKDLEIAVSDFIYQNNIALTETNTEGELSEIVSVIEVIYKDIYCEQEAKSNLEDLILKMLKAIIPIQEPTYCQSDLNYLELKMAELQTIPQPAQRTQEWYEYRNNRLTASDLWSVMDENQSKMYDILKKKCGVEQPYKPGVAMLHGIKFESVATRIYELRNNVEIIEFGCMPHRFIPYFGASPDGICSSKSTNKDFVGRMLEIKCPKSRVITGFIPEGYRAQIETTLGQDFKRYQSLLPTYLEHPELVIRSRWLNMYSAVLGNADAESIFVPEYIKSIKLAVSGSDEIAQLRHRNELKRKEATTVLEADLMNPWILKASEINMDGPRRSLNIDGGTVQGRQP